MRTFGVKMYAAARAYFSVHSGILYGSSESNGHRFPTHLLSDYFLLGACPLLSAYFLAVSCYKRMRLTTSTYGIAHVSLVQWYCLDSVIFIAQWYFS